MKVEKCHRNPLFIGDFAYDGEFSDGNPFSLRIPEDDIVEFAQTLLNAYNKDKNGEVKITFPAIAITEDGLKFIKGKIEAVKKDI